MSSTTLATGQTVTLTGDTGVYFVVSTSGGIASMTVTPINGRPETENIGPLPYRRTWGPYKDGATAVIVNQTAPALAYEQLSEVGGGNQSSVSGAVAAPATLDASTAPALNGATITLAAGATLTVSDTAWTALTAGIAIYVGQSGAATLAFSGAATKENSSGSSAASITLAASGVYALLPSPSGAPKFRLSGGASV